MPTWVSKLERFSSFRGKPEAPHHASGLWCRMNKRRLSPSQAHARITGA